MQVIDLHVCCLGMINYIKEHKYLLVIPIYGLFYIIGFFFLENRNVENIHIVKCFIDDYIPFCEYFVLFYYGWFLYMLVLMPFIVFDTKDNFVKTAVFLIIGMTSFLIISYLYPNGQQLRPLEFERNNIFTGLVSKMYEIDTPTNILPSIHVYNALGFHLGFIKCKKIKDNKFLKGLSAMCCFLISISTLFIKQHSVVDVILALAIAAVAYYLCFICFEKRTLGK